jgi:hypothetical protein
MFVSRIREDVDEVADFAIAAVLSSIDYESQIDIGELALQSSHDSDRGILFVAHTADDLKHRISLFAASAQALVNLRVCATQWF